MVLCIRSTCDPDNRSLIPLCILWNSLLNTRYESWCFMFRLLVTGSRDWKDRTALENELRLVVREFGKDVTLISGSAVQGADAMCESYANRVGWLIEAHPADWVLHGKSAGFKRNALMVERGADRCLAFIKDGSAGASHTADLAEKAQIQTVRVVCTLPKF